MTDSVDSLYYFYSFYSQYISIVIFYIIWCNLILLYFILQLSIIVVYDENFLSSLWVCNEDKTVSNIHQFPDINNYKWLDLIWFILISFFFPLNLFFSWKTKLYSCRFYFHIRLILFMIFYTIFQISKV